MRVSERQPQEFLREYGDTPAEVRAVLAGELQAMEVALRARQADWTRVQAGRTWSPAQEIEHVILIDEAGMKAVRLLLSDRPLRPVPQQSGVLREGKRVSPPFAEPALGLSWAELTDEQGRWAAHCTALMTLAEHAVQADPARRLWHPFLGELDALDWLRSLTAHLRHHRALLECRCPGGSLES